MLRYVIRRLAAGVVLLLAISLLGFTLLVAGSGDVGRRVLGQERHPGAGGGRNAEFGLDRPIISQYVDWLRPCHDG